MPNAIKSFPPSPITIACSAGATNPQPSVDANAPMTNKPLPATLPTMEDEPRPPQETLFAGEEALLGRPPKVSPAEGLKLMRARLEQLHHQLQSTHALLDQACAQGKVLRLDAINALEKSVDETSRDIADTKQRIAEYEAQLKAKN